MEKNQSTTVKIDINRYGAAESNGRISHIQKREREKREKSSTWQLSWNLWMFVFTKLLAVCYRTTAVFFWHFMVVRFPLNLIVSLIICVCSFVPFPCLQCGPKQVIFVITATVQWPALQTVWISVSYTFNHRRICVTTKPEIENPTVSLSNDVHWHPSQIAK